MTTNDTISKTNVSGLTFGILCLGGFCLSIAYGVTFLIPTLIGQHGGDEVLAGFIISAATLTTVTFVILSGHIADIIGSARAVCVAGIFLALSGLIFAFFPAAGLALMFAGLILGVGWGVFYTLGPILVAAIIEPHARSRYFALLSGSMLSGIGAGPIIGRICVAWSLPLEAAFCVASIASIAGSILYYWLHHKLIKSHNATVQVRKISRHTARKVTGSKAIYSIVMVGIGGAIFGGISSFQTSYAALYEFDYSLFFIGFMIAAISCRLFVSSFVVKKDPLYALVILTAMMFLSIIMFLGFITNPTIYLATAAMLGIGYGLTYVVINGLAASEAPPDVIPQSLLLFSLSYFIGVFGFPLLAGYLIVSQGIEAMIYAIVLLAMLNMAIAWFRVGQRAFQ